MKTYRCYKGCSRIPLLYEAGSTGGVATTLALAAIQGGFVDGMVVSRRYETFIAHNLDDLIKSCGSIYENYPYRNFKGNNLGQIGKPCDMNENYAFKISLFCSHTSRRQKEKINRKNRPHLSRINNTAKCWICKDHLGEESDISVGDTQIDPKQNILIIRTNKGLSILEYAKKMDILSLERTDFREVVEKQPYLWRRWRK